MTDWIVRAAALTDELTALGKLRSPQWQDAVRAVPRHEFVPVHHVRDPWTGSWTAQRTALAQAYSNVALFVLPDGASSSSVPGLTMRMLESLDVRDGDRVLEIGTGTGYTAALLCHRLGSDQVHTVEIDTRLADDAVRRLTAQGFTPSVRVGDGRDGDPLGAPYDRILATCAVPVIPPAWLAQLRDGGLLLADVTPGPGAGNLVLLRRDGDTATGRFDPVYGGLTAIRGPDAAPRTDPRDVPPGVTHQRDGVPGLWRPWECPPFWLFAHLLLPAGTTAGARGDVTLLHAPDGSWCAVDAECRVREGGPQQLWRIVETRYGTWLALGEPGFERFGLTVTPQRQWVWLDDPDGGHTRDL